MSEDLQKKIFSQNLLRYLSLSGKTQKDVADTIHVSPQTFNTWCQGIALPRMGKIQALADYFGIEKSDLLDKHVNTVEETVNTPKIKIIKRDGKVAQFDMNSLIYTITEAIMDMPRHEQEALSTLIGKNSSTKKNIVYVENPQYAKVRKESTRKNIPYETAKQVKKYGGAVAFLKKNCGSLITSIIDVVTLDDIESLNLSIEINKLLKKIVVNKGYDNFNDIEAKHFLTDFVLPVAYKDIVFKDAFFDDVYNQCHYITSLLTPAQRTKYFSDSTTLNAAHERTDVEVTDEMRQQDDDYFDER